jgi:hypothetical protein
LLQLKDSLGLGTELGAAARLAVNLVVGGVLSVYLRELYKRFSNTISNRDSFASVFPLLTLTTILVICVVRSSLALSLGLVGALSIVRFRAAIKEPEELVFLFFCIAIGLALGADHKLLALVATAVVSVFVVGRRWFGAGRQQHVLLTVSGDRRQLSPNGPDSLVRRVDALAGGCRVQRFDVEDGQMQLRAVVRSEKPEEVSALVDMLQNELPKARISYVNLETLL